MRIQLASNSIEKLYYWAMSLFIIEEVIKHSLYCSVGWIKYLCMLLLGISCALQVFKFVFDFFTHRIPRLELAVIILLVFFCIYLIWVGKTGVFMFLLLFSATGHDIPWQKLVKVFALSLMGATLFILMSHCIGLIGETNLIQLRGSAVKNRWSCGFDYYYSASHYSCFALLVWLYYRKEKISLTEIIALLLIVIFIFARTDTKMPFYLSLVALIGGMLLKYCQCARKFRRVYGVIAIACFPLAAVLISVVSFGIKPLSNLWLFLNKLTSNRIYLNLMGYQNFGIRLLGNNIVWSTTGENYNLVDSSYLSYLFEYGVIFLAGVLVACIIMGVYSIKIKDTYYVLFACILAVYAMFDGWLLRPECNLFMYAFPYVNTVIREMKSQEKELSECGKSD